MIAKIFKVSLLAFGWYLVIPAIAGATECEVTVGFTDNTEAAGILVDIAGPSGGEFVGGGDDVECRSNVPGGLATFNHKTFDGIVTTALIRIDPFEGSDLFSCTWSGSAVSAADFEVVTLDATDGELSTIDPFPQLAVTDVSCDGDDGTATDTGSGSGSGGGCYLVGTLNSSQPVSGLMVDLYYNNAGFEVPGQGDGVDCYTLVPGGLGAYNDQDAAGNLTAAIIHMGGFSGTNDLFECYVDFYGDPGQAAPQVVLSDVVDPSGNPISPLPDFSISYTDCSWDDDEDGEDGDDDGGADSDSDSTNEGGTSGECDGPYDVTFAIVDEVEIGSLQFTVEYDDDDGSFSGSGDQVECTVVAPGNGHFASFNDQEDNERLLAGVVSMSGLPGGNEVVTCTFDSEDGEPSASDFSITVNDASDTNVQAITPTPSVVVEAIVASADNDCFADLAQCGNGEVEAGEECDDGNDSNDDSCLNDCTENECGDGYVDSANEECDDSNNDDTDECLSTCTLNVCGDGAVHAGVEACDDGAANSDTAADACRSDCTLPACGDGVADDGEFCDDGNDDNGDDCLNDCVVASCGDGYVHALNEFCDPGLDPEGCLENCTYPAVCGDVDGNGTVTATDSRRVLESSIGLAEHCDGRLCDVDGNARVTASDAQLVLGYAVGVGVELDCSLPVIISLVSEVDFGALQFTVDYAATGSTFVGDGADVYCVSLIESGSPLVSANNVPEAARLNVGIVSIDEIAGPVDLLACSMYATGTDISPELFTVEVTDAVDGDSNEIDLRQISISVSSE